MPVFSPSSMIYFTVSTLSTGGFVFAMVTTTISALFRCGGTCLDILFVCKSRIAEMNMDVNESRRYDTAVCVDHLLIASVIFHFSDSLYLSPLKDNVQDLRRYCSFASTTRPFLIRII